MIYSGAGKGLRILFYVIVVITLFMQIYPLCWVIFSSFKDAPLAGRFRAFKIQRPYAFRQKYGILQ
jgi:ABC-type glycerol-3-phosphate transport system permease component